MDVRLPDGRIITNVPEGTTKAQLMAKLNMPTDSKGMSFTAGALDSVFGLADEAGALVGAGIDTLQGQDFGQAYDDRLAYGRNRMQELQDANPGSFMAGQVGGGIAQALTPIGAIGQIAKGGNMARAIAPAATQGALYGFGSGEGVQDRLERGLQGGVVGGLLGAIPGAVQGGYNALRGGASKAAGAIAPGISQEAAQVADDFNIPLTIDQIAGGRVIPATAKVSSQAALTGGALREGYGNVNDAIEGAIRNVSGRGVTSTVSGKGEAAQALKEGFGEGLSSIKTAFNKKYNKVYDVVPTDTPLAQGSIATEAQDIIRNIGDNGTLQRIVSKANEALRPQTITQARRLVSDLDGIVAGNAGKEEGMLAERLRSALRADIDNTVSSVSPEAGELLQRTNRQYAQFKALEENARRIIGKAGNKGNVEQIVNKFLGKAANNTLDQEAIKSLKRFVPNAQWKQFGEYAARSLGDINGEFSPQVFARNVKKMDAKALEAIFNAPGQADDLRRLVRLIDEVKPDIVNPSGTAGNVAEVAGAVASPLFPLANIAIGKVLTNPKLSKAYLRAMLAAKNGASTDKVVNVLVKNGVPRAEASTMFSRAVNAPINQAVGE